MSLGSQESHVVPILLVEECVPLDPAIAFGREALGHFEEVGLTARR